MNTVHRLTFVTSPGVVAASILIVLAVIGIGFYSWRRSGYRRAQGLQELLRVIIVTLVAVLWNQPEWIEEYRPRERPTIAVLWDQSPSMQTQDVIRESRHRPPTNPSVDPETPSAPGENDGNVSTAEQSPVSGAVVSRARAIERLADPAAWQSLDGRLNVVLEPISAPVDNETGTDLYAPLYAAPDRLKSLLGIVLLSDGDWNTGRPPVEAATRLRMKGIPVFTIPVGSRSRLPDVELTAVDLPTFGVAGKVVRIPFTIDSSLPREFLTTVTLKTSDGETLTRDVKIAAMGRTSDSISWKPAATGDFTVTVEVPRHADEINATNNVRTAPIAVREEKLKVLLVESYPRWEYRYLRNALSRDPGVEVSCMLFHPGLSKPGGGTKDYLKAFPASIEELAQYDVVFLGDVGVEPGQLDEEQCRLLKGLVEHQASGLVFMPGWQGREESLLDSPLEDLFPVVLDPAQPGGWGSRSPGRFELTEHGRRSLLTRLADTPEENVQLWEDLPGFQWYAAVLRARPGSEVLAVHADVLNEYGRMPLLVTRTFGAGKVLFMGTDGAWRWRKGVEDKYHYRFWGQVVRWMAYQRNMAKGETMRLYYTPDQPRLRQTLALHAHVMERSGEPLAKGDVALRIVAPSGKTESLRLTADGQEWGVFQGRYVPEEAGTYDMTLSCRETEGQLHAQFFVQGEPLEQPGKPARPEVLEEIARVTNGRSFSVMEADQVVRSLASLPLPAPSVRRVPLWSHPLPAALIVTLLGVFWVWRKALGLI